MKKFFIKWLPIGFLSVALVYFLSPDIFPGLLDDGIVAAAGGTNAIVSLIIGAIIKTAQPKKNNSKDDIYIDE